MITFMSNLPKEQTRFFDTLLDMGDSLSTMPERFSVEPNVASQHYTFRFIPKWNYKIIYRINKEIDVVVIARILSTRQNPGSFTLEPTSQK